MACWTILLCLLAIVLPSCAHAALFWLPGDTALAPNSDASGHASAPWSPRRSMRSVVLDDRIVAIGGSGTQLENDVWEFANNVWTRVDTAATTFTPRADFTLNAFAQKLVLIGGKDSSGVINDVHLRSGSAGWTRQLDAPFAARSSHCAIALGSALFVFAGWNAAEFVEFNDVWSWTGAASDSWLSLGAAPFSPRFGAACTVYNGTVVMVGGTSSKANLAYNDVWVFDGTLWDSLLLAAFTGRSFHSALVFGSSLLVLGGSDIAAVSQNQVWSYAVSWGQSVVGSWSPRRDLNAIVNPFAYGRANPGESLIVMGGQDEDGPRNDGQARALNKNCLHPRHCDQGENGARRRRCSLVHCCCALRFAAVWVLQDIQPPSAPLSVDSTAIQSPSILLPSSSVLVSWTAPLDSGGSPVIEYLVSNDFDAFVQNCSAPGLQVLVAGLTFPANYTFRVQAVNLAGRGATSDCSNTVATAAAGRYVNWGGPIPTEAGDSSAAASSGPSPVTTRVWFIVLLVLLSVGLFVLACFLIVRRHLQGAQRDLQKLEEIENMDDEEAGLQSTADNAKKKDDGVRDAPLSLASVGITGIGRRSKAEELERWRRGESTSSAVTSAQQLDPALTRPLGFAVGSDEEAEAIARLGAEMDRLQRTAEAEVHEESAQHASPLDRVASPAVVSGLSLSASSASSPSEGEMRVLCDDFAESLCDAFHREYTLRMHRAAADDSDAATSLQRMGPFEEIQAVISHALYASAVLQHVASQSPPHRTARSQLHDTLYAALLDQVSSDALAKHALRSALESSELDGGTHLFLLARATMLRWMFERVKRMRNERGEANHAQQHSRSQSRHEQHARTFQEPAFRAADALTPSPPARRVLPTSSE